MIQPGGGGIGDKHRGERGVCVQPAYRGWEGGRQAHGPLDRVADGRGVGWGGKIVCVGVCCMCVYRSEPNKRVDVCMHHVYRPQPTHTRIYIYTQKSPTHTHELKQNQCQEGGGGGPFGHAALWVLSPPCQPYTRNNKTVRIKFSLLFDVYIWIYGYGLMDVCVCP